METPDDRRPGPAGQGSDAFFAQVYDELRGIAHARMRGERTGHSLQTTELVHEAYFRLRPADGGEWGSRRQFFAAAAEAMRRILVDHARARGRLKRGGDAAGRPAPRLALDLKSAAVLADDQDPELILSLDHAIEKLAERDARAADIVRMRFYAGLSVAEVAEALELSTRTVLRDWGFARAWLYGEIARG
ncbi:MAG: ECF-type sigma factor [Candidatus Eisenbacteria bacterium]